MPVNVSKALREALSKLSREKQQIDRQIDAIEAALQATDGRTRGRPRGSVRAAGDQAHVRPRGGR